MWENIKTLEAAFEMLNYDKQYFHFKMNSFQKFQKLHSIQNSKILLFCF